MNKDEMIEKARTWLSQDKRMKSGIGAVLAILGSIGAQWAMELNPDVVVTAIQFVGGIALALIAGFSSSDTWGKGKVKEEAEQMRLNAMANEEPLQ